MLQYIFIINKKNENYELPSNYYYIILASFFIFKTRKIDVEKTLYNYSFEKYV